MQRITQKQLQAVVDRINSLTNSPMTAYELNVTTGKYRACVGNYHLDGAYGGFALYRIQSEGGSVSDVLGCGHVPKRELYNMLHSFIRGIESKEAL